MGSHQRLQPGMVIRGQRDRACKRHGHSHCPYDERRRHLTGTSPSCYPLLSSQSTGTGFTKWTSSNPSPGYVERVAGVFTAQRDGPTQLQEVVRAILLDPEARGTFKD